MSPKIIFAITSGVVFQNKKNSIALFLKCSRKDCGKFYCLEFPCIADRFLDLREIQPSIPYTYSPHLKNDLPKNLNNTFPGFKKIYDQSLQAESMGLDEIAGVGYRKAIEFLLKEFVISKNPEKRSEIESKFLGNVINENLDDLPRIQTLAKAAVWIGNDETHFVKIHSEKDLKDMKGFLSAAALYISAELKADEAEAFINPQES
ncbi:hypothetical protein FD50_GL001442 [Liquorilactobacillus satsumensis DSM 16230 = JCM 12392]|uniref:Uncharacterized protein n=2 Tax=Liquorilactobacillus satsumensis TaxID=259059 RepID=A0A0R1V3T5_9LACO|nr:hypothetical protein FD50_GL001442 [Liquorilactobacillus satsumensis DSM 16230 = JCM 12392]